MKVEYRNIEEKFLEKDYNGASVLIEYGLSKDPSDINLYRAKARLLRASKIMLQAEKWFTAVINHSLPSYQDYYERGANRYDIGDYEGAIADFTIAELFRKDDFSLYIKRGGARWEMRDWDGADKDFGRALEINPNNPDAIWVKGLIELQTGRLNTGWPRYEARWMSKRFKSQRLMTSKPKWSLGSKLKRVLVWGEQGVGDQIFYSRILPYFRTQVDKVTAIVDPRLISLMKRSIPDVEFLPYSSEVPTEDHDSHIPIASLCFEFIKSIEEIDIFSAYNYLIPDPVKMSELKERLGEDFFALSWTSAADLIGIRKSISLGKLEPITSIPNTKFVNVQYVDNLTDQIPPSVFSSGIDCKNDFEGLLALLSLSKGLISVSSTTVHLAGALGKPVLLMDANKLWYWGNRDENNMSYWYPNVKIFPRDNVLAPWDNVVEAVREEFIRRSDDYRQ